MRARGSIMYCVPGYQPELPVWDATDGPPAAVTAFANAAGVSAPTAEAWRDLTVLQRFVLVKLSRDDHDNVNFVPALREFGWLGEGVRG